MGSSKSKMDLSMKRIRAAFMDWDPIGVRDDPHCADEYDSYVLTMYSILRQRKSEAAVLEFLQETYERIMGGIVEHEKIRKIAAKFLEIDVTHDEIHHRSV
jgi:hypothetical protein